jgi:hypothetical protein
VVSSLVWLWWIINLAKFEFESGTFRWVLPTIFVSCRELRLLVSWCAGGKCGMADNDKDHGRNRKSSAEDQGWSRKSDTRWPDDREVRWRCVRSGFLVEPQKQGRRFVSGLASKPLEQFVNGLASKPQGRFSLVWPQNRWWRFFRFGLITGGNGFSWFSLKSSGGFLGWASKPRWWLRFPSLGLKTGSYGLMIWGSKSVRWFLSFGLKTKCAMICRLCLKINGRMWRHGTHVKI